MREKTTRIHRPSIKVKGDHVVCGDRRGTNANEKGGVGSRKKRI
jgi:hypothetical protein